MLRRYLWFCKTKYIFLVRCVHEKKPVIHKEVEERNGHYLRKKSNKNYADLENGPFAVKDNGEIEIFQQDTDTELKQSENNDQNGNKDNFALEKRHIHQVYKVFEPKKSDLDKMNPKHENKNGEESFECCPGCTSSDKQPRKESSINKEGIWWITSVIKALT